MNFFERAIAFFSPSAALKRQAHRKHLSLIDARSRKYEGASKASRLSMWNPNDSSANEEVKGAAVELRQRARDLRRNNAYAHRAIQVITSNVVGSGIKPVFKASNKRVLKLLDDSWKTWAEKSVDCDYDGRQNIQGIQTLVMDAVVESGECFVVRRRQPSAKSVPLKLMIFESDFLDTSHNEDLSSGAKIRQGIEFNSKGERVAYHFFKSHPGETGNIKAAAKGSDKVRTPADQVIHIFEKKRPGQIRGVTFLHPVMIRLQDLDIFQDASLKKQQIAACYSAFIYNSTGDSLVNTHKQSSDWELLEKLDSGTIEELPPGYDIKFADPPSSDQYPDFIRTELMSISSGLGITYESLVGDYSNVNFSSARMGFLEFQRNIKRWQNDLMITQLLNTVFDWFLESVQFSPGAQNFNINPENISVSWTLPAREMIDPSKEIQGHVSAVEGGFKSISSVIRSMGDNPSEVFEERSEELKELQKLGIKTFAGSGGGAKPQPTAKPDKEENASNSNEENQEED